MTAPISLANRARETVITGALEHCRALGITESAASAAKIAEALDALADPEPDWLAMARRAYERNRGHGLIDALTRWATWEELSQLPGGQNHWVDVVKAALGVEEIASTLGALVSNQAEGGE